MEEEPQFFIMDKSTTEIIKTTLNLVTDTKPHQMGMNIRARLKTVRKMEKVCLSGRMGLFMKVNLRKIIFMGKEPTNGPMGSNTQGLGKITGNTGKASTY